MLSLAVAVKKSYGQRPSQARFPKNTSPRQHVIPFFQIPKCLPPSSTTPPPPAMHRPSLPICRTCARARARNTQHAGYAGYATRTSQTTSCTPIAIAGPSARTGGPWPRPWDWAPRRNFTAIPAANHPDEAAVPFLGPFGGGAGETPPGYLAKRQREDKSTGKGQGKGKGRAGAEEGGRGEEHWEDEVDDREWEVRVGESIGQRRGRRQKRGYKRVPLLTRASPGNASSPRNTAAPI